MCSLNDLPYSGWPVRDPIREEGMREDAVSRQVRLLLQRPLQLAGDAYKMAQLSGQTKRLALLDRLRAFPLAVTHTGWNDATLPILLQLHYLPRECGKTVRRNPHTSACMHAAAGSDYEQVRPRQVACKRRVPCAREHLSLEWFQTVSTTHDEHVRRVCTVSRARPKSAIGQRCSQMPRTEWRSFSTAA